MQHASTKMRPVKTESKQQYTLKRADVRAESLTGLAAPRAKPTAASPTRQGVLGMARTTRVPTGKAPSTTFMWEHIMEKETRRKQSQKGEREKK
jgi:hypothetical protein